MIGTTCSWVREALSARLDGEDPPNTDQPINVDEHLSGCVDCHAWLARAQALTRAVRVRAADPVPDRAEEIMAAVAADPVRIAEDARRASDAARLVAEGNAHARRQILRIAVAGAAAVQLALALPALVGALLGHDVGPHAGREMASFDAAVAVGFLFAAYRPGRARGFVPVALVLAACLAITSGVDVARGMTTVGHEFGHLVAVVQAGLLWVLGRAERMRRQPTEHDPVPAA